MGHNEGGLPRPSRESPCEARQVLRADVAPHARSRRDGQCGRDGPVSTDRDPDLHGFRRRDAGRERPLWSGRRAGKA